MTHACTMVIVLACQMGIVPAFIMAIAHACTIVTVRCIRGVAVEVMVGLLPPPDLMCWIFPSQQNTRMAMSDASWRHGVLAGSPRYLRSPLRGRLGRPTLPIGNLQGNAEACKEMRKEETRLLRLDVCIQLDILLHASRLKVHYEIKYKKKSSPLPARFRTG